MASFPGGTSQSPKCGQITPDFHHGGAEIHSHGNMYSGYRWTFPASTAIRGLTRMPYLPSHIMHSIVSHQETSYHSKEVQPWGLPHGINWSYHIPPPPHLEGTGLKKRRNGLLRSHYGTSWQTASCKNGVLSYRCSVFFGSERCSCSYSQNTSSIVGVASLTVTSNNPLAGFLLPVLTTLSSAGLEILVSNKEKLPQGTQ